jgi:hypothetical protein
MANKFVSWLENVPAELKKFFTNPVVDNTIVDALGVGDLIDPALAPLFNGISASVVKAEALAAAANAQNGSGAQKLALAIADAQEVFATYEQATGVTIESTQQTAIVNAIVALLNNIPSAAAPVPATPTPAPSVQAQAATGTLL